MKSIYDIIDSSIMSGINSTVRAYNWTTGKTKADLANKALFIAPIADATGALLHYPGPFKYFLFSILLPINIAYSHLSQKRNIQIEKMEVEALEKKALDMNVESYKQRIAAYGTFFSGLAAIQAIPLPSHEPSDSSGPFFAAGNLARGLSIYLMRADYLPPKKNVLSRALDKVGEQLTVLSKTPVPVPVNRFSSLEESLGDSE